jgi:hypothetical protein
MAKILDIFQSKSQLLYVYSFKYFIARLTLGEKMRCVRNIMHEYVIVDVWFINVLSQRISGIAALASSNTVAIVSIAFLSRRRNLVSSITLILLQPPVISFAFQFTRARASCFLFILWKKDKEIC